MAPIRHADAGAWNRNVCQPPPARRVPSDVPLSTADIAWGAAPVGTLELTRRQLLQTSTIAVAGLAAGVQPAAGAVRRLSANEKLNVACVGVGGQGKANLGELAKLKEVNIVALCDVDSDLLAASSKQFPAATTHRDFRRMFDTPTNYDAVLVATPDPRADEITHLFRVVGDEDRAVGIAHPRGQSILGASGVCARKQIRVAH